MRALDSERPTSVWCLVSFAGILRDFFHSSELDPSLLTVSPCGPRAGGEGEDEATYPNVVAFNFSARASDIFVWGK